MGIGLQNSRTSAVGRILLAAALLSTALDSASCDDIVIEHDGLALDRDEFDNVVARALGCADQRWIAEIEDLNRRTGSKLKLPQCTHTEASMKSLLTRVHESGGDLERYLTDRHGKCDHSGKIIRCIVVRNTTSRAHTGDPVGAPVFKDIFTVVVEFHAGGPPTSVQVARESLMPNENKL